jgi:RPA family protein
MDILKREVAKRVFAFELSQSSHETSEGGERAPKYILTPTGEKCNRVFMVGVLLEKEEVSPDSNFWRIRVSDPTGVVSGFVGRYQPEALESLLDIEPPEIVSIIAKLNLFKGETRNFISIRPETINVSDRKNRDFWVIETAKRTLERIKRLKDGGEDAKLALQIYNTDTKEYLRMVRKAVEAVREEAEVFESVEAEEVPKVAEGETLQTEEVKDLSLESFELDDLDEFELEEEEWDLTDILDEE